MRVYLDMRCYNRPYDDPSQLRVAMEPGEFHQKALEYAKAHPYTGNAERL